MTLMGRAWCCLNINMEKVIIPCSNQVRCDGQETKGLSLYIHCIKKMKPIE